MEKVKPVFLKSGEPQLTMTTILSLDDLAGFFAALCDGVTRQQTRAKPLSISNSTSDAFDPKKYYVKDNDISTISIMDAILERDFLESVMK